MTNTDQTPETPAQALERTRTNHARAAADVLRYASEIAGERSRHLEAVERHEKTMNDLRTAWRQAREDEAGWLAQLPRNDPARRRADKKAPTSTTTSLLDGGA